MVDTSKKHLRQKMEHERMLARQAQYHAAQQRRIARAEIKYSKAKKDKCSKEVLDELYRKKKGDYAYFRHVEKKISRNDPMKRHLRIDQ